MNSQNLIEKFIYSLSHDLKAPISSIQGLVRIAEYYPHHEETHKCLEMIDSCSHEMEKRIARLREYMVNSNTTLVMEAIDPDELFQSMREKFRVQLGICKIELIGEADCQVPLTLDSKITSKILEHLIANSIAFHDLNKEQRTIALRIESTAKGAAVDVSDNGKGISEDQLTRIFDVFVRGTEQSIGLGMGLFLAKSLTEKMGGTITCKSVLNEGTTIHLSFKRNLPE